MRMFSILTLVCICIQTAFAQEYKYTDAQQLTVVSKLLETKNPYHRIETSAYEGFTVVLPLYGL